MGQYLARYYLSCGHVTDVPATMDKLKSPVICERCSEPTEIPSEILEVINAPAVKAGVTTVH